MSGFRGFAAQFTLVQDMPSDLYERSEGIPAHSTLFRPPLAPFDDKRVTSRAAWRSVAPLTLRPLEAAAPLARVSLRSTREETPESSDGEYDGFIGGRGDCAHSVHASHPKGADMSDWQGLWSYVHDDDDAEGGRIARLARDVKAQYEMLTGDTINLFLDKDALEWGDKWHDKIDEGLASIAFFMPVVTPRYFLHPECRRELRSFAGMATRLGIQELVLPLLYIDVPAIHDDAPADDLVALVKTFQWVDWTDLRFADLASEAYRRGVHQLASRLVDANTKADETDIAANAQALETLTEEATAEAPGLLDQLALSESAVPEWTGTIEDMAHEIEIVGAVMEEATRDTEKADEKGKGFAARLLIARRTAERLREPADRILERSNAFASHMHEVDEGFRVLIDQAPAQAADPEQKATVCEFFESIRAMSVTTHESLDSTQGMIDSISELEKMSRDLRAPLRRMKQGLITMLEAREVIDEWVSLIDRSGVDCSNLPVAES